MKGLNIVNNDIVLKNGDFKMLEDDILVSVERLLTTNLTEFFLDLTMGMEYDIVQQKRYVVDEIRAAVMECVLQDERIATVKDIEVSVKGRKANITFNFIDKKDEVFASEVIL